MKIQEYGQRLTLTVRVPKDLDRGIVKSEAASIRIPELDLEIPKESQKGTVNTIEGVLRKMHRDLNALQSDRRLVAPEQAELIDAFLARVKACYKGEMLPFNFILDDPSGNSHLEPAGQTDNDLWVEKYVRTAEQLEELGYQAEPVGEGETMEAATEETVVTTNGQEESGPASEPPLVTSSTPIEEVPSAGIETLQLEGETGPPAITVPDVGVESTPTLSPPNAESQEAPQQTNLELTGHDLNNPLEEDVTTEALCFPIECHACQRPGTNKMCVVHIPHFQEIVTMSFLCDFCGAKSTEVKPTGAIADHGHRLVLSLVAPADLDRDIVKSDSAAILIPEIELEVVSGSMGGLISTVEGLLKQIHQNLVTANPFVHGDSTAGENQAKYLTFLNRLKQCFNQNPEQFQPFTLVLDDPLAACFIAPEGPGELTTMNYERTEEQSEELGLHQMNC